MEYKRMKKQEPKKRFPFYDGSRFFGVERNYESIMFCQDLYLIISAIVPATSRNKPVSDFLVTFSFKKKDEKVTVNTILSWSIGVTMLAWPSCKAR